MSTLQRAIEIALAAHQGQVDKAGEPYVLHPLRVMLSLTAEEDRIVAVLHDVVEDCENWSFERLESEGFSAAVIEGLRSVSKLPAEERALAEAKTPEERYAAYETFVLRAAQNPIGKRVKLADLTDNANLKRISSPTPRDLERVERYRRAIARLESA